MIETPSVSVPAIPRRQVIAWAFWDWAGAAFNAVITTFVFTIYLTSNLFVDPQVLAAKGSNPAAYDAAVAGLSSGLALALTIGGVFVALIAPVMGQRSDSSGRRKLWLGINTGRSCSSWPCCSSFRPRRASSRTA